MPITMEIITFNSPFTFEDFKLSTYLSINNSTLFKILPVHCLPDPHPSCGSESKRPLICLFQIPILLPYCFQVLMLASILMFSEQEFWTKFFQSHYFHRDRVHAQGTTDIFVECAKVRQQREKWEKKIEKKYLSFSFVDCPYR